jgi:hypothetical protein
VLPVLYQICLLCFDGFSDHIIVELAHQWRRLYSLVEATDNPQMVRIRIAKSIMTLLSSSQQNLLIDDQCTCIEQVLENFLVGTEKRKLIIYQPCSLDTLLPLLDVDMRSVNKVAEDRLKRRHVVQENVSDISNTNDTTQQQQIQQIENSDEQQIEIIPTTSETPSHRIICKFVSELKKLFPLSDSTIFDTCMGYKIIESRANPVSINRAGATTRIKRQLKLLVEYGNNEYRSRDFIEKKKKDPHLPLLSQQPNNENNETIEYIEDSNNEQNHLIDIDNNFHQSSSSDEQEHNDNNNNIIVNIKEEPDSDIEGDNPSIEETSESTNKNTPVRVVKKARQYCCVCPVSSLTEPSATFTYIPYSPVQKKLYPSDNDDFRKKWYIRKYKRGKWLRRCGKLKSDKRKTLLVCNKHEFELATVSLTYIDSNNISKQIIEEIKLPLDINAVPNRTRLQSSIRKPAPIKNNRTPRGPVKRHKDNCIKSIAVGKICSVYNCKNYRSADGAIKFKRIFPTPTLTDNKANCNKLLKNYAVRCAFRNDVICCINANNIKNSNVINDVNEQDINVNNNNNNKEIRVCNQLPIITEEKIIEWSDTKQKNNNVPALFHLPVVADIGRINKGLANDRRLSRDCQNSIENKENVHPNKNGDKEIGYEILKEDGENDQKTIIKIKDLTDAHVKMMTGFSSLVAMIGFIIVVSDGKFERIQSTTTKLTWFEEWMVFFEVVWCKSSKRWVDMEYKYKISEKTLTSYI